VGRQGQPAVAAGGRRAAAESGWQPPRTYLAYGADEEVSGQRGAAQIAALLKSRGAQLDFVIDEGLLVLDGVMPGLKQPAALVGIAERATCRCSSPCRPRRAIRPCRRPRAAAPSP
jgi:acetylornithine deacetylase/succinyl-diaminopimelate desuccinylase-like protein